MEVVSTQFRRALLRDFIEADRTAFLRYQTDARYQKLARWFGTEIVGSREGPEWMRLRGWHEVDWAISSQRWEHAAPRR